MIDGDDDRDDDVDRRQKEGGDEEGKEDDVAEEEDDDDEGKEDDVREENGCISLLMGNILSGVLLFTSINPTGNKSNITLRRTNLKKEFLNDIIMFTMDNHPSPNLMNSRTYNKKKLQANFPLDIFE
jgi:hypothetical protein